MKTVVLGLFILFFLLGCSRIIGTSIGDGSGELVAGVIYRGQIMGRFYDLFDKKSYRVEEYEVDKVIVKLMRNSVKSWQSDKFLSDAIAIKQKYYSIESIDFQSATILDPWGSAYFYRALGPDEFIMGTMGPNRKWNVRLTDRFLKKLRYGNLNIYGDDIFVRIKQPAVVSGGVNEAPLTNNNFP